MSSSLPILLPHLCLLLLPLFSDALFSSRMLLNMVDSLSSFDKEEVASILLRNAQRKVFEDKLWAQNERKNLPQPDYLPDPRAISSSGRRLASGDFQDLNRLMGKVQIALGDFEIDPPVDISDDCDSKLNIFLEDMVVRCICVFIFPCLSCLS